MASKTVIRSTGTPFYQLRDGPIWAFEEGVGDMVQAQSFLFTLALGIFFSRHVYSMHGIFPLRNMPFISSLNECEFFSPVVVCINVFFLYKYMYACSHYFSKLPTPLKIQMVQPHCESRRRVLPGV